MFEQKIRILEESYRVVDNQIFHLEKEGSKDIEKIKQLTELKKKYLNELRELRKKEYEDRHTVDFGDDR